MSHSSNQSTISNNSISTEKYTSSDQDIQQAMTDILDKLRNDPGSITTEDARRLSENTVADDLQTARIISAVESFAIANEAAHEIDPELGQAPHTSLLTVVNDLKNAVEQNPGGVTTEILRTAQNVVSSKSFQGDSSIFKHLSGAQDPQHRQDYTLPGFGC